MDTLVPWDFSAGYISSKYNWVKSLCPWDLRLSRFTNEWCDIKRHVYSNVELLRSVSQVAQLVDCPLDLDNNAAVFSGQHDCNDNSDYSDSDESLTRPALPPATSSKSPLHALRQASFRVDLI